MQNLFRDACLILTVTWSIAPAAAQPSTHVNVAWTESPAQALAEARRLQRPILAFVTSAHCHYCQKMDAQTWRHPELAAALNGSFVPLRIDAAVHPELVRRLNVRAFPTTIVFTTQGQPLQILPGFLSPHAIGATLGQTLAELRSTPVANTAR